MNELIGISNLTRRFGAKADLDSVSLSLERGAVYGLVGGYSRASYFCAICVIFVQIAECLDQSVGFECVSHPLSIGCFV